MVLYVQADDTQKCHLSCEKYYSIKMIAILFCYCNFSIYRCLTTPTVQREMQTRLSCSSLILISHTMVVFPIWKGEATAVTAPDFLLRTGLTLISIPKTISSAGSIFKYPPILAAVSANKTLAPPCKKPAG